jgi:hypothetical protein
LVIGTEEVVFLPHAARMVSLEAVPEKTSQGTFSEILAHRLDKNDPEDAVSKPATSEQNEFTTHHRCIIIIIIYLTAWCPLPNTP